MITGKLYLYDYKKPSKKGHPVKILITNGVTKKKKDIHLRIYSFSKDWDYEKVEPKRSHFDYNYLMDEILDHKKNLNETLKIANKNSYDVDRTIKLFNDDNDTDSFIVYAKGHVKKIEDLADNLEKKGDKNKARSKRKTASIKNSAIISLERFAGGDVLFSEITKSFLRDYSDSNNGAHTYLAKLKSIYNESKDHTAPFKGVMPKLIETRNKNISIGEMRMISNNNFKPSGASSGSYHYANYFLLCFYLG